MKVSSCLPPGGGGGGLDQYGAPPTNMQTQQQNQFQPQAPPPASALSTNQQDYQKALEPSQQISLYHYSQLAAPPMGGAPPYNSGLPPPGQQFGQGGIFTPGLPFTPQQYPPFQQFGAPLPGQQQPPPTYYPPPHVQWAQPGMEQGHHGTDPRRSQSGGPCFPYARVYPRYQQQGGPMNPPQGGMGNDHWRHPPDQMPPPPAPQQQQDGSHWNTAPSGPPVNAPPSYQRPPPPSHQQNSNMPPVSGLAPFQQPQPPYQSYNTDQPQPILKRSVCEAGMDLSASGFKIPKLQDSSGLNRPMDPGEHPLPTKGNKMDKGTSSVSTNRDKAKDSNLSSKHTEVYSYTLTHFNMGVGDD